MSLSERLQIIADLIPFGASVADIGADHAKLTAYLLKYKGANCLATDVNAAPLARGKAFLGDSPKVEFRLGDGLQCIEPQEVEVIVIAGMGGETIADILKAAPWSREKHCILQPASRSERLRQFLYEQGYNLYTEILCMEAGRFCPVIGTQKGQPRQVTADYHFFSDALRENRECVPRECVPRECVPRECSPSGSLSLAYLEKQCTWLGQILPALQQDVRPAHQALAAYYKEALDGLVRLKSEVTHDSTGLTTAD